MRQLLVSIALLGLAAQGGAQALPAEFDHDRIFLVAHAPDGATLRFYTDSGGGFNAFSKPVVERLKLPPAGQVDGDGQTFHLVEFPAFAAKAGVPPPPRDAWLHGKMAVADPAMIMSSEGFLGSRWFAGRTWRLDYGRHEMALLHGWKPGALDHKAPLGFPTAPDGTHRSDFARLTIAVDGQPLDVLLDTGATITTTDRSAPAFGVAPGARVGGSFITKTQLEAWHAKHPDWRVIEQGDDLQGKVFPVIEVPTVSVAGFTVGPVWFAQRPDANLTQWMSAMMDKEVVGAFGGSGLRYFHVVLDYPAATAWFGANATSD
jgi:hypothetical protein